MSQGFVASQETVRKIWNINGKKWEKIGPPWRPSKGDLKNYHHLSRSKFRGTILILGSTPEIRDLIARNHKTGKNPVLVDMNLSMLEKMSHFLVDAKPENETWIVADWCDAPFSHGYFDLILADMTWWVISVKKQKVLAKKIATWLKPDGKFISRVRVLDYKRHQSKAENVVADHLQLLREKIYPTNLIRDSLVSFLHDITTDRKNKRIRRKETKRQLLRFSKTAGRIVEKKFLEEATKWLTGADWTSQTMEEIFETTKKYLIPQKICHAYDYDSTGYPIIEFRKRKH